MRTSNFAATIRRVFAIRNNVAAIVTGKRASSHKHSAWHASPSQRLWQAFSSLRFARCYCAGAVHRDADLMPLGMGHSRMRMQPCSVATQRVCEESVERS